MTVHPNSPLELDAVFYAMSRGEQASFVPRLRATLKAKDAEIARYRLALAYLAGQEAVDSELGGRHVSVHPEEPRIASWAQGVLDATVGNPPESPLLGRGRDE